MKRPYLNMEQREAIRLDTMDGACFRWNLAVRQYRKECGKGLIGYLRYRRNIKKALKPINNWIKQNWK